MKRNWLLGILGVLALFFTMALPTAVPTSASPVEHHRIRAAITQLQDARDYLEHAPHDFGGHKAAAMRSIDGAIEQLNICLQYDK